MPELAITNRKSILPRHPSGPGGPKSGGGPLVLVSEAAADVSDVELPEPLSLELPLELELDDEDASGVDVGPMPKLDSAGTVGLQASADAVSARGAIRRTRAL